MLSTHGRFPCVYQLVNFYYYATPTLTITKRKEKPIKRKLDMLNQILKHYYCMKSHFTLQKLTFKLIIYFYFNKNK